MKNMISILFLLLFTLDSSAASEGAPLRYCNPLPVENQRSIGDPAVIRYQNKYYLFTSGGFFWSSDDLVNWKHHQVTLPGGRRGVGAPSAFEFQGFLCLTGSNTGIYRTRDPLGSWEYIGDFKDEKNNKVLLFDPMVFVDDDSRVYMYYTLSIKVIIII